MNRTSLQWKAIKPTVFFVRTAQGLRQAVDLIIHNSRKTADGSVAIKFGSQEECIDIGTIEPGERTYRVYIPDIRESLPVEFILSANCKVQDRHSMTWTPQRHWRIYLVHNSHHDLGYTDLPTNVMREQDGFMDEVLRFCEETEDWPEESKFRYTVEQAWSVLHFIENRPKETVDKLVHYIKEGRIEVTAFFGNEASELCSHEELIRLMYPSFRLKRKYGIPIRSAELNDVSSLSWGLATILAGAGVKYFAPRLPGWYATEKHSFWDESAVLPLDLPAAFRWQGPDGTEVLFWYCIEWRLRDYQQVCREFPERLAELEKRGYPFDIVRYLFRGAYRDNSPPSIRFSHYARKWNDRWAYPRIITATNSDFFAHLEREYGDKLPIFRGELPTADWAAVNCTAKETGINRITSDRLHAAEAFAAIAAAVSDYSYPGGKLNEAYDNVLLYDEHTWGQDQPIGPAQDGNWSEKGGFAYRAAALTQDVLSKTLNKIADQVNPVRKFGRTGHALKDASLSNGVKLPDDGVHVIVFNPLSWDRTDVVRVPVKTPIPCGWPMHWGYFPQERDDDRSPVLIKGTAIGRYIVDPPLSLIEDPFDLIDTETGEKVPYQVVELSDPHTPAPYAAERYALGHVDRAHLKEIVFVAENVPPMGYKTYRIVPNEKQSGFASHIEVGDTSIENHFFRVALDPETGVIRSIYDKELDREIVDGDAPHGVNQFIARWAESGQEESPQHSTIKKGEEGPVYGSLVVSGSGAGCPQRTQEIILYDRVKRLDFANRLLRDATPFLEIYFAFPFKVDNPRFHFEGSCSVIEPLRDQFPGSNSDTYAIQHWADVSNGKDGVLWSSVEAPIVEFGGLWPGRISKAHHAVTPPGYEHEFLKPGDLKKGHIYSYVMDNNFCTNFNNVQVSDVLFRYALTTHKGDWKEGKARDFGWAVGNPLIPVCMNGKREGTLPASTSFCIVDQPNVLLLTLKQAEDGNGFIVRLIETEGRDVKTTVTLPFLTIVQAYETNLVEENQKLLTSARHTIEAPVKAFGITTIRVQSA